MTNPLRRAAETLQNEIESTVDPRRKRSLSLALGSTYAAQSKFYPPHRLTT